MTRCELCGRRLRVTLDWWKISPSGYPGSHYATFPPDLCVIPVKAMSPERVCVECGKPSVRVTDVRYVGDPDDTTRVKDTGRLNGYDHPPETGWEMSRTTIGWSDCGHNTWRPGHVLDPFGGTGTTALVAAGHGRDATLIDLDARNVDLARERLGFLLTDVVDHSVSEAAS